MNLNIAYWVGLGFLISTWMFGVILWMRSQAKINRHAQTLFKIIGVRLDDLEKHRFSSFTKGEAGAEIKEGEAVYVKDGKFFPIRRPH